MCIRRAIYLEGLCVSSCDVIIYLCVLNLQFDILDDEEQQRVEPGHLQKFKQENWPYLNCFGCLFLVPSA